MKTTLIIEKNYDPFQKLLFDGLAAGEQNVIRIGAIENGEAVGALSAQVADGRIQILSLYVIQSRRRQGAAHNMLEMLIRIMQKNSFSICSCDYPSDVEGLTEFFDNEDYQISNRDLFYRIKVKNLISIPTIRTLASSRTKRYQYFRFDDLSKLNQNNVMKILQEKNYETRFFRESFFDGKLSGVVMDRESELRNCILVSSNRECVFIELLLSLLDTDEMDPVALMTLLKGFLKNLVYTIMQGRRVRDVRFLAEDPRLIPFLYKLTENEEMLEVISTHITAIRFL